MGRKTVVSMAIILLLLSFMISPQSFALWVDVDGYGTESENVTVDTLSCNSEYVAMYLDNLDRPYVAFDEGSPATTGNIRSVFFLKWNGTAWVDADGTGTESARLSTKTAQYPSLGHDSSYRPYIAWIEWSANTGSVHALKWSGTEWTDMDGTGRESEVIYDNVFGEYLRLRMGPDGNPQVVWSGSNSMLNSYYDIYYLKWNGSAWVDADGTGQESADIYPSPSTISRYASFDVDSTGLPCVCWAETNNFVCLKWNGTAWVDVDGTGQESMIVYPGAYRFNWVEIDASDRPHVLCDNGTSLFYLKWNGTAWVDIDGTGQESAMIADPYYTDFSNMLRFDSNGYPCVAYSDNTDSVAKSEVRFIRWNGSAWVDADGSGLESTNVSNDAGNSRFPQLCIGSDDNPHIFWHDYSIGGMCSPDSYFLKWVIPSPTETVTETITPTITATPTITETTAPVIEPTATPTPKPFMLTLYGNYPNPFRHSTRIVYWLSRKSGVRIRVFTVSGEIVRDEQGLPGNEGYNSWVWDGKNNDREDAASGVFIYCIYAVSGSDSGKEFGKLARVK